MNTILWALSSKCNFHCKYCYLDFSENNNPINNKIQLIMQILMMQ